MAVALTPAMKKLASALAAARTEGTSLPASDFRVALRSPEQAYAVQAEVLARTGELPAGTPPFWKSGGPSRTAPLTHAALPPARVYPSPASLGDAPLRTPVWVEAEVALRIGRDVEAAECAGMDREAALRLVDAMAVSIEVVASRWNEALDAPPLLKLADLQSNEALVLGEFVPFRALDWSDQSVMVIVNGRERHHAIGSHLLGDPTWLLPEWLAHATRSGDAVARGTVVTTGTWCGILPVARGDRVAVVFDGIGKAAVEL